VNSYGNYIVSSSENNYFWLNIFEEHIYAKTVDYGVNNLWDYEDLGNYWSDYSDKYPSASDLNGIWNEPYNVEGNSDSYDNYPLANQFNAYFITTTSQIMEEESINFIDLTIGGVKPLSYEWEFGDGTVNSTEQNPLHQYNESGNYDVTLTVTDIEGNVSSYKREGDITVLPDLIPVANFSTNMTIITANQLVYFHDLSTNGNLPLSYSWNFGDGSGNSTERNPIHQYNSTGNYTVTLTVMDVDGDTDSIVKIDYIIVQNDEPSPTPGIPGYSLEWMIVLGLIGVVIVYRKITSTSKRKLK
jgi:PKD repeat protein